jgi:hypothetical protein
VLLSKLNQLLVGNATSGSKNHAVGSVVVLDVVDELGAGNVTDVLAGSENGAAKRLMLESGGVQMVKDNLLNLLLNLLGLSENDVALALDSRGLELGVLQDIGQNIDGLGDIGVEGLGEVDGVLTLKKALVVSEIFYPDEPIATEWVEKDQPKCRRSGGHPCSQSRAPIAAVIALRYP